MSATDIFSLFGLLALTAVVWVIFTAGKGADDGCTCSGVLFHRSGCGVYDEDAR